MEEVVGGLRDVMEQAGIPDPVANAFQGLANAMMQTLRTQIDAEAESETMLTAIENAAATNRYLSDVLAGCLTAAHIHASCAKKILGDMVTPASIRAVKAAREYRQALVDIVEEIAINPSAELLERIKAAHTLPKKEETDGQGDGHEDGQTDCEPVEDKQQEGEAGAAGEPQV